MLFLFRNVLDAKVIVSTEYLLQDTLLNQTRGHLPGKKIRRDHWTPYAIVTNVTNAPELQTILAPPYNNPGPKVRLPIRNIPVPGPQSLMGTENGLKVALKPLPQMGYWSQFRQWTPPSSILNQSKALCDALSTQANQIVIHWERPEYYKDIEWPAHVTNVRLEYNGKFPSIEGFDVRKDMVSNAPRKAARLVGPKPVAYKSLKSLKSSQ